MLRMYGKYWWSFFSRGVVAILFGLTAIVLPGITLEVLAILLAAFLIVDGIFSFMVSIRGKSLDPQWWLLLLEGSTGIVVGVLTMIWPGLTVFAIIFIVGFWALLTGVLELAAAIKLRHEIRGEWLLGLSGIISILFSFILFLNPGAGAVVMIWLVGAYAIIFGGAMIFLGLNLRKRNIVFAGER